MRGLFALVVVVACDAGAKSTPPPPPAVAVIPVVTPPEPPAKPIHVDPHSLLATIERGPCYGTCPVYSLTVYRDGAVDYEGKQYVKKVGKAKGTITAEQVAALDKMFIDGKYLDYKSAYESYDVTDSPSAKTSYQAIDAEKLKTVSHYYGDRSAPESLGKLEHDFDTIVKIDHWIGTRAERDTLLR